MRRAYLDFQVDMYVIVDPTSAGNCRTWCAVLGGCMLVDARFFRSGGQEGLCIRYSPQIRVERIVAMTDCFVRQHKTLAKVIAHFVST